MTAPDVDPVVAFAHALPPAIRAQLNKTVAVTSSIHTAVRDQHWTPQQLAAECARDLADVINAGAVITERLRKAAQHPPVARAAAVFGPPLPWCTDDCRARAGWIEDDRGNPIGRCPCRTPTQEATTR
jgi:hypothetical protein